MQVMLRLVSTVLQVLTPTEIAQLDRADVQWKDLTRKQRMVVRHCVVAHKTGRYGSLRKQYRDSIKLPDSTPTPKKHD